MTSTYCLHTAGPLHGPAQHPSFSGRTVSRPLHLRQQYSLQQSSYNTSAQTRSYRCCSASASCRDNSELWTPPTTLEMPEVQAAGGGAATVSTGYDEHRARTPPPDLPSLLLDSRIVYLGMPLVPAVSELIVAELLYLQYQDRTKPLYMYINSTGTSRADGETVGFETEGTAIYDTMCYLKNEINTVGVGVAIGQSCMILSAGTKGKRFMLPHATAMLQQPRVPPTGQRQAVEIQIKWREVLAQKQALLDIMSKTTGHSVEKLDADMQRPLYMQPKDAIEYGVVDGIVQSEQTIIDKVKKPEQYDKEAGLVARPAQ